MVCLLRSSPPSCRNNTFPRCDAYSVSSHSPRKPKKTLLSHTHSPTLLPSHPHPEQTKLLARVFPARSLPLFLLTHVQSTEGASFSWPRFFAPARVSNFTWSIRRAPGRGSLPLSGEQTTGRENPVRSFVWQTSGAICCEEERRLKVNLFLGRVIGELRV